MNEKIWNFIEKKKFIIFFVFITIIAMYARCQMLEFVSGDFESPLKIWYAKLKENGGLLALDLDLGVYSIAYFTILALLTYLPVRAIIAIKMSSILFDFICAIAVMKIVYIILKENKNKNFVALIAYGITLFLPTMLLNSACWAQCDTMYVAFILLAIAALLEEKYLKAFIYLGVSFAIKLQFVFILPLFVLIYISKRKFPLYYFLIIPLVNIIMCLPAICVGRPISECLIMYVDQATLYNNALSMNFPGIYNLLFPTTGTWVYAPNEYMSKVGIISTLFVFAIMAFMVLYKKIKFNKQQIIEFGLWSVMATTFLLPHMHERYLLAADILSVLYCIYHKDKLYVPIGITLVSMYGYSGFLFGEINVPIQYISFMFLILIYIVTKDLYDRYFAEKTNQEVLEQNNIEK